MRSLTSRLTRQWKIGSCLLLMLWAVSLRLAGAQTLSSSTIQDPFESDGVSARDIALGNAFVGVADDSTALFYNPAGLATLTRNDLGLDHLFGLDGITQDVFTMGLPVAKGFGLGFTTQFVNYGTIQGRNADGTLAANSSAYQFGLGAGAGVELFKGFSIGADIKGTAQELASYTYSLLDVDAGMLWAAPGGFRIGASFENFGTTTLSASSSSILRVGLSQLFADKGGPFSFLGAGAYSYEPQFGSEVNCGVEACFRSAYFLRAGFEGNLQNTELNGLQGLTAGAGVDMWGFRLDYAFVPYGDLGATNRISLTYIFGGKNPTSASATQTAAGTNTVKPEAVQANAAGANQSLTVHFDMPSPQVSEGEKLEQAGNYLDAVKAYDVALKDNPQDVKAWYHLAKVYFKFNQKAYAIQCFEQVIRLKPDDKALASWLEYYKNLPSSTPLSATASPTTTPSTGTP